MPPTKLAVATSSVTRLIKEEASYHKELAQQETRIKKLESNTEDENAEYQMKQERQALQETKDVLPNVREKIKQALERLEEELENNKEAGGEAPTDEVTKAKEAVAKGKEIVRAS
ncbi:tubulin binding cofactor A [Lophiotrema nucula]|uniref:Tubulin-specific chaperone A n=1 Tax=Lophiotrema nucula TaxID=690887 RepID=A0A6A5Z8A0_9PLEO|nr:tubulin binding cofactor A [Lophiotrema nucula]